MCTIWLLQLHTWPSFPRFIARRFMQEGRCEKSCAPGFFPAFLLNRKSFYETELSAPVDTNVGVWVCSACPPGCAVCSASQKLVQGYVVPRCEECDEGLVFDTQKLVCKSPCPLGYVGAAGFKTYSSGRQSINRYFVLALSCVSYIYLFTSRGSHIVSIHFVKNTPWLPVRCKLGLLSTLRIYMGGVLDGMGISAILRLWSIGILQKPLPVSRCHYSSGVAFSGVKHGDTGTAAC